MKRPRKVTDGPRTLVVGSDAVGAAVTRSLPEDVVFVGFDRTIARRVANECEEATVVDDIAQFAAPESVQNAVVTTDSDSTNLLVAQRLRMDTGANVLVRLNDPSRRQVFADLDVETVCSTTEVSATLAEQYTDLVEADE